MCGITGFWTSSQKTEDKLLTRLRKATDVIEHRGPDDEGHWVDPRFGTALGFRRLSIQDLSEAGHQPMSSHSGRYTMTFNGEVYNAPALREKLPPLGYEFRGHSDTEIMLAAFENWGIEESLKQFIGMFAIALWDSHERVLTLTRDRVGIKPLHYGVVGDSLVWGSELKSIESLADHRLEPDPSAIDEFFQIRFITAPRSIYKGIHKLIPGQILQFKAPDQEPIVTTYWSVHDVVENGRLNPFKGTEQEAIDGLEAILKDSIDLRMLSDVPLGAFLSGGIDSSTVVALMQSISSQPVKTFTIGFTEQSYDESDPARAIAKHLRTDHHELRVTPREALEVIPLLPKMYDEPFADASQIPTYLVSKLARTKVTVSLSGDGGDEVFAGYNRYRLERELWSKISRVPRPIRTSVSSVILGIPPQFLNRAMAPLKPLASKYGRLGPIGPKMHRLARLLRTKDSRELSVLSEFAGSGRFMLANKGPHSIQPKCIPSWLTVVEAMQYDDMHRYLPDDILCKVDRASMAVSLEARVPILDHRVIEYAWALPESLKMPTLEGKWVLRQVLYKYVPKEMMDRPKTGFGIPVGPWLKTELRDWAEALLSKEAIAKVGILDHAAVRKAFDEHLAGTHNNEYKLWSALMLQGWGLR